MLNLAIEAPWMTFHKKVKALFENDPDIHVGDMYDAEKTNYAFDIEVKKHDKFIALDRLLTGVKTFGNVTVGIVLYDEENAENDVLGLFKTLFDGNHIMDSIQTRVDQTGTPWNYILFKPEVIQFYDDDMTDYNGNWSGLAEDIAREVFENNDMGIFFCTAAK